MNHVFLQSLLMSPDINDMMLKTFMRAVLDAEDGVFHRIIPAQIAHKLRIGLTDLYLAVHQDDVMEIITGYSLAEGTITSEQLQITRDLLLEQIRRHTSYLQHVTAPSGQDYMFKFSQN